MNFLENTSNLYAIILFLLLVVIFILFLYLRQKKQLAKEKGQANISRERIDLFLAANADIKTMFEEIAKVNSRSLKNIYLKEKIKSRLVVRSHDLLSFSKTVSMIKLLPKENQAILKDLLFEAVSSKPPYYLGGLLSRSIIEMPFNSRKSKERLAIEEIVYKTDVKYNKKVLESAIKYTAKYLKGRGKIVSENTRLKLKNEIVNLKIAVENLKE